MDSKPTIRLPQPSPEQRRAAAGQFERANQVITTGNFDYGIQLLLTCCRLDPANAIYREKLRQVARAKFKHNRRGSRLAWLTTIRPRLRLLRAQRAVQHDKVLEYAEQVLVRNPWDVGAQRAEAEAFVALGLVDQAVWSLEQARLTNPKHVKVNKALARLYEKRGNFTQAMGLWELIRKTDPTDVEAHDKAKDIAVSATIARGGYEQALQTSAQNAVTHETALEAPGLKTPPETAGVSPAVGERNGGEGDDRVAREAAPILAKIKTDPTSANAYLQVAGVYRRADQFDRAREVLQQGLGPTGNNFELACELADLEIEPFRRNLAVTEEKLQREPKHDGLRAIRVRLVKEINTRELHLFRQKSERFPTDMMQRFELGVRLLRAGQLDEAIKELQAARADPKCHWRALLHLGFCFSNRSNWRLAQRNFADALQQLPAGETATRKELLFQLAQGHADAGELDKAVEYGYELANLDFAFRDIGRLLDAWQTQTAR